MANPLGRQPPPEANLPISNFAHPHMSEATVSAIAQFRSITSILADEEPAGNHLGKEYWPNKRLFHRFRRRLASSQSEQDASQ